MILARPDCLGAASSAKPPLPRPCGRLASCHSPAVAVSLCLLVDFRAARNALSVDLLLCDRITVLIHLLMGLPGDPRRGSAPVVVVVDVLGPGAKPGGLTSPGEVPTDGGARGLARPRETENDAADRHRPDSQLDSGAWPSEAAVAAGPLLAEAGAAGNRHHWQDGMGQVTRRWHHLRCI